GRAVRLAARAGGRVDPSRAGDAAPRGLGEPDHGAARHAEPVRRGGPGRPLRLAPTRRRARSEAARARPRLAREAPRGIKKGPLRGAEDMGGVLLSREIAPRLPSTLVGLTPLFGMGRGVSPSL